MMIDNERLYRMLSKAGYSDEELTDSATGPKLSATSGVATMQRYRETYRRTRDHRAAIRSAYGWNKWAVENAKAVGNW